MPSALQDRTQIEILLEIALSLVTIWSVYKQTKVIQNRSDEAPSKFWYYTSRITQEMAYKLGQWGIKAENNYYKSLG